jgi:aminoglycoside 6'-N-acetyltransferase I
LDRLSGLFIPVFNSAPWDESWEKSWALERLTILYNSYKFCGFLAVDGEAIIGAAFSRLGSFMGELELEVVEMFVSGQHQRAGVGKSLVDALEGFAIKNKISALGG